MTVAEKQNSISRFWEVDTLRGIAIVAMIFFHLTWDLSFFGVYQGNMLSRPWQIFARSIATVFLFVMGISLTLSYNRVKAQSGQSHLFSKYLLRGLKIFGLGMIITVVTYFMMGRSFVVFGILHLLGSTIILAYPFLHNRWASLGVGLGLILTGIYVDSIVSSSPWLLWLGVKQLGRHMVDYYPLLPWSGITFLGIFVGYTAYPEKTRRFSLPDLSNTPPVRLLSFLGQHSLLIYMIHQPILFAILFLVGIGHI